jgi:N-acetylneuraminic acid mutarotase
MKKFFIFFVTIFIYLNAFPQSWQELNSFYLQQPASSFPTEREGVFNFSTADLFYIGNGGMSTGFAYSYPNDLYTFDLTTNLWQQINPTVFAPRISGLSFFLNGKAYVCYGMNNWTHFHDTWEYEPLTGTWTQRADGPAGFGFSSHFSSAGKEYFICRIDSQTVRTREVFEFNPGTNTWTQMNPFPAQGRISSGAFAIADTGYILGGWDSVNTDLKDLWKYDASNDSWVQKSNCPDSGRISFSIGSGTHGYCLPGWGDSLIAYDPLSDSWSSKNPPPQIPVSAFTFNGLSIYMAGTNENVFRYDEAADQWIKLYDNTVFVSGHTVLMHDKAYCNQNVYDIATDTWLVDTNVSSSTQWLFAIDDSGYAFENGIFSRYDPVTSTWAARAFFPGVNSGYYHPGLMFSVGNKGYLGVTDSTVDFWEYDPSLDSWAQMANYPGGPRTSPGGMTIAQKGYAWSGWSDTAYYSIPDFWEYDPIINQWTQKSAPPTDGRINGISCGGSSHGYAGLGRELAGSDYDDIYEYDPSADTWTSIPNPFPAYVVNRFRSNVINFVYNDKLYTGGGVTRLAGGDYVAHYEFFVYNSLVTNIPGPKVQATYLYPSITSDHFFLQSQVNLITIEIFDCTGNKIKSMKADEKYMQVDVSELKSGVYFITTGNGEALKFVKQ